MEALNNYIQSYFGISNQDLGKVATLFYEEKILKGEYFSKEGQYCKKMSFVRSGFLRVFSITEKKEVTQWITSQDYFVTDLRSFVFEMPGKWDIQALTDCELYTISHENYRKIGTLVPKWDHLEKLFLAKCFITLEDRVFSFLSMSAEERFHALFQFNPELFNQVPLNYLASMMGMTPETLSRIRKKMTS